MQKKTKIHTSEFIFIFLTALAAMLICTKSSPLYPTNDWLDANCYMTVGRAMLDGKLPYRDLFEHKGPIIYMLHALGALVSDNSFFGIFLAELAACCWFLCLSFRLLCFGTDSRPLWTIPLIAVTVYSSGAFCHGDSVEEFCLPLLLCSQLLGLNAVTEHRPLSAKEAFMVGLLSGIVLWTKFNLLGFYIGFFIMISVLCIKKYRIRGIFHMCLYTFLGISAVSLPVIIYFKMNNALDCLFDDYFYSNLFVYRESSLIENLCNGFVFLITFMPIGFTFIYLGTAISLCRKKFLVLAYHAIPLITAFFAVFAGHLSYQYYPLILAVFIPSGLKICLEEKLKVFNIFNRKILLLPALLLCPLGCYALSQNTYLMKYDKEDMPQYKFAEIMPDSPNLLNYGFLDGGFYSAADTVPDYRYFCKNNSGLEAMESGQEYYAEHGLPDYIVTRSYSGECVDFPLYTCISEADFPYCVRIPTYYLYARNDLVIH